VNIPDILIGGVSGIGIALAASTWIGKAWANRFLERDRIKYETQMQATLSELRMRGDKERFVHQLQFEKEFAVYTELWVSALALARSAMQFRELRLRDASVSMEDERQDFMGCHSNLNDVVFNNRPFYAPEVYDIAKKLLHASGEVYGIEKSREEGVPVKGDKTESLLDDINDTHIPKLVEAIRSRIWTRNGRQTALG